MFINLTLLCVACLFSERKKAINETYFRHEGAKTRRLRRPSRGRKSQVLRSSRYRPACEHLRARLRARCEPVQDTATAQEPMQTSARKCVVCTACMLRSTTDTFVHSSQDMQTHETQTCTLVIILPSRLRTGHPSMQRWRQSIGLTPPAPACRQRPRKFKDVDLQELQR